MEYFENIALGPELPVPIKDWKRYVDDVLSIIPKGNRDNLLQYLNSIDPHIKFTIEQPNAEGGIPFLDTFPKPQGENIPSINDFNIIDKEPSQVTREAKEVIHIRWLDPSLNRNIGKMSIPHCFDNLLGAKPKHPRVGELSATPLPVEEVAPPPQIPGLNLTQFNNIGNFRPNMAIHIPRHSTRACRAKNLFN